MKYYTGVGSRKTPEDIQREMTLLASDLSDEYILRSGGADGADLAFELGVTNGNKEIYLPWNGFNGNQSELYDNPLDYRAEKLAARFHAGNWKTFKESIKKLHTRNVYQVLGHDLETPSDFLLCWTPDYCESHKTRTFNTGGTGTALSIADYYEIPIINMSRYTWREKLLRYL